MCDVVFMDDVWQSYSGFHDAHLASFSVDLPSRTLTLTLIVPLFDAQGGIERHEECAFTFNGISHLSITSNVPTYQGSNYSFPVNGTVDSFVSESREGVDPRLGAFYGLRGIYVWQIEWIAETFSRVIIEAENIFVNRK